MHGVMTEVIAFALLIYMIVRQVTPRRPRPTRFYILPIIALIIAAANLPHPVPQPEVWDAIISVGISIPFGIMQAYFTTVYESNGQWYMTGDWRYAASWLVLLGLKAGSAVLLNPNLQSAGHVTEWIVALDVAVVWGLRSVVLHVRYHGLSQVLTQSRAR